MSREIKFRAWDKNRRYMHVIFDSTTQTEWFIPNVKDNYEIMQYTGLKDTNGKEIYEGDFLKCRAVDQQPISNGLVSFRGCSYLVSFTEGSASGFYYLHHILFDSREVIGNIYENPDLLKGDTNAVAE